MTIPISVIDEKRNRIISGGDLLGAPGESGRDAFYTHGILGVLKGANFNITTDQSIPIAPAANGFIIDEIVATNASISLTTAAGGIYSATSKGGSAIVAAAQVYSALTVSTKKVNLTIAITDTVWTLSQLYFSLTTAQGSASTGDIYVIGWRLV